MESIAAIDKISSEQPNSPELNNYMKKKKVKLKNDETL
jgi:hypothetical protein